MTLLLEPPVEVVWAEQAGPMSWVEPGSWEPAPVEEPGFETAYRLAELEAACALAVEPVGDWRVDWAVPGVPRFGDASPAPVRPLPSPEVAAYAAAVEALAAVDAAGLSPEQALVDLGVLLATDEQHRVARLVRLTDGHVRKLAALDDEVSLQTWARKRFDDVPRDDIATSDQLRPFGHLRRAISARLVTVEAGRLAGRALRQLRPHLDRADGLIDGQPAAELIAAVVGNVVPLVAAARLGLPDGDPLLVRLQQQVVEIVAAPDSQLGALERAFTLMAELIPLRHLKGALAEQVDALLPAALEEKAEQARRRREVRLDPDRRSIAITPDDELYELAHTVLTAEVRRDPENPADTDAQRQLRENADAPDADEVESVAEVRFPRSRGERLHDALKLVLQRYLAAGLAGSHDKAPVAVTVTVGVENLEKRLGARPAIGGSGRRLPSSLVSRWWCDSSITTLVVSAGLIPLGATHTQRTLTALERRASLVQHGHGCDGLRCCTRHDPLTTLAPHHVEAYAKTGKTSMADTVWVCPRLHDAIHRGKTVPLRNGRWLNQHGWTEKPLTIDY